MREKFGSNFSSWDRGILLALPLVVALLAFSAMLSCAKGEKGRIGSAYPQASRTGDFRLELFERNGARDENFSAEIELSKTVADENLTVTARLVKGSIGPDLMGKLEFDSSQWKPKSFQVGDAWGGAERVISLGILNAEDSLPFAISFVRGHRNELVEAGELFRATFSPAGGQEAKAVSEPPSDEVNHISRDEVQVTVNGGSVTLSWKEKNRGDYDRDGEVSVADVPPLAEAFFRQVSEDPDTLGIVDGDDSGVIDIADIVPIAENIFRRIEGYRVWRNGLAPEDYLPNIENPSDTEVSASRPSRDSSPPGALIYSYTDTPPNQDPAMFYRLYAYADGEVGARSDDIYPFGEAPDETPPEWQGPEGIQTANPGNSKVYISWTPAVDADSPPVTYLLYWAESSAGINWNSPQQEVPEGTTSYLVEGLANDVEYVFGVKARDSAVPANLTTNTNTLTATPSAGALDTTPPEWQGPPGIQTANPGNSKVYISWTPAVDADSPPVTYLIYYAPSSTGIDWNTPQDTAPEGTTTMVISGLINGTEYVFGVRARDSAPPPNDTQNTNTLTATPKNPIPYPFGIPPVGANPPGHLGNEVALDNYGSAVFFVSVENELTGLKWFYYDETNREWVVGYVDPNLHRFYHPDVVLTPEGIFVSAFDIQTGELKVYRSLDGSDWTDEVLAGPFRDCQAISMKYSQALNRLAIAAVFQRAVGDNEELDYFTRAVDEPTWTQVLLDNSEKVIYWTDLEFTPDSSAVAIAYTKGNIDNNIVNTILYYGEADPITGAFSAEPLTDSPKASYMDLEFSPSGVPVIAFTNSRTSQYLGTDVPLTDMYVAQFNGTIWEYSILEEGFVETDFQTYVKIVLTGADPTLEFTSDGDARLIWSYIDVTETVQGETLIDVDTKQSRFTGGNWTDPQVIFGAGSSANHMRLVNGVAVASWVIPNIDPEAPPQRNDFPNGPVIVWRPAN